MAESDPRDLSIHAMLGISSGFTAGMLVVAGYTAKGTTLRIRMSKSRCQNESNRLLIDLHTSSKYSQHQIANLNAVLGHKMLQRSLNQAQ